MLVQKTIRLLTLINSFGALEGENRTARLDLRAFSHDFGLFWKFDTFVRSTRHLLTALEEFDHLRVRFISVQD